MTMKEYRLQMEAFELKKVDMQYWAHWNAYLNLTVKAKKKVGKHKMAYVYKKFSNFFNYSQEIKKVMNKSKKKSENKTSYISKLKGFYQSKEGNHG